MSSSQFQFVKKGTNIIKAPFQDDDPSRLCILNMGTTAPMGVKTSSWGKNLSTITSSPSKYRSLKQIYSISGTLKFLGKRDDWGKNV